MNKRWIHILLWILTVSICVGIFCFSAQDATQSSAVSGNFTRKVLSLFYPGFRGMTEEAQWEIISGISFFVRKWAHFTIYCALGFFACLLSGSYELKRFPLYGWGFAAFYACTDEYHQTFVPGRAGQLRDVCIDASGALLGVLIALCLWKLTMKRIWRKHNSEKF